MVSWSRACAVDPFDPRYVVTSSSSSSESVSSNVLFSPKNTFSVPSFCVCVGGGGGGEGGGGCGCGLLLFP